MPPQAVGVDVEPLQPVDPAKRVEIHSNDDLVRWESTAFATLTFFLQPITVARDRGLPAGLG
jgi:hypothetical protein